MCLCVSVWGVGRVGNGVVCVSVCVLRVFVCKHVGSGARRKWCCVYICVYCVCLCVSVFVLNLCVCQHGHCSQDAL